MASKRGVLEETATTVSDRDGWACVRCGRPVAGGERGVDWSIHHRRPRGMGGSKDPVTDCPANLVVLCGSGTTLCHGEVEADRAAARERGLLVWQSQDPREVPIEVCVMRASGREPEVTAVFWLGVDGGRYEEQPPLADPPPAPVRAAPKRKRKPKAQRRRASANWRAARARRLEKRIQVDGRWFHPDAPHGSDNGYNAYGCRCLECRTVHAAEVRAWRERRRSAGA